MPRVHPQPNRVRAVFATWTTYATWLRGDARGWKPRRGERRGADPNLERFDRDRAKGSRVLLDAAMRRASLDATIEACAFREWPLLAANFRTNHAHVLVATEADGEAVLNVLKRRATDALRQAGLHGRETSPWTAGGWRVAVRSMAGLMDVVRYVLERQGIDLGATYDGRLVDPAEELVVPFRDEAWVVAPDVVRSDEEPARPRAG